MRPLLLLILVGLLTYLAVVNVPLRDTHLDAFSASALSQRNAIVALLIAADLIALVLTSRRTRRSDRPTPSAPWPQGPP